MISTAGSRNGCARISSDGTTLQRKVLFVLNPAERDIFLPGFECEELGLSRAEYHWVDASGLNAAGWEKTLSEHGPTVMVTAWGSPAVPREWVLGSDCPLRYVCHITGSVRRVVSREMIESGLLVTNWGSTISYTVAEHALLLLLGALRGVPLWPRAMTKPSYSASEIFPELRTRSLRGKRVGIHGFGAIARELVKMLKPHGVHLAAYSRPVPRAFIEKHDVTYCSSLEELFSRSDILIECESLTPETKGMVTGTILDLLPADAVFVNVGRAGVVDETALAQLAAERKLRVALDVYQSEPLPANSPWFEIPEAFLSPHIAGPTWDASARCGEFAMGNVAKFLRGESVEGVVTPEIYDHST